MAKLGQVSKPTVYGRARLVGGLTKLSPPIMDFPDLITFKDTRLPERRFKKLGKRDREFAYLKAKHPGDWKKFVADSLDHAVHQARSFSEMMRDDRNSLVDFISAVMAGSMSDSDDYFLLIGNEVIQFKLLIDALTSERYTLSVETYDTGEKKSFILWVQYKGERYCLVKIEPAFDGSSLNAEQVKGIIFYFQQHLPHGNHYKKLFRDLLQQTSCD